MITLLQSLVKSLQTTQWVVLKSGMLQVEVGSYPTLVNEVVYLPEDPILGGNDCANFTETEDGMFNASDVTIYTAHHHIHNLSFRFQIPQRKFEGDRFLGFKMV